VADEPKIYRVKGSWIDEPFVTFGYADMIMLTQHREVLVRELRTFLDNASLLLLNEPTKALLRKRIAEIQLAEVEG
jgi:hypothetical protein